MQSGNSAHTDNIAGMDHTQYQVVGTAGAEHLLPALVAAPAGAVVRRALNRLSANLFLQPFCAAVLAGVIGAVAVRWDLSSSLRLVAVRPCMFLVPGPHFLKVPSILSTAG